MWYIYIYIYIHTYHIYIIYVYIDISVLLIIVVVVVVELAVAVVYSSNDPMNTGGCCGSRGAGAGGGGACWSGCSSRPATGHLTPLPGSAGNTCLC